MGLFGSKKKKALVADDNVVDRLRIAQLLEERGCEVVESGDVGPVVRLALKEAPDLILLGNNLPLLSAATMVAILRSNPETEKTPIIVVSSNDNLAEVEQCLSHGANDYVVKPFEPDRLLAKVDRLLTE